MTSVSKDVTLKYVFNVLFHFPFYLYKYLYIDYGLLIFGIVMQVNFSKLNMGVCPLIYVGVHLDETPAKFFLMLKPFKWC